MNPIFLMLDSLPFMSCIYVKYNNLFQGGFPIWRN